MAVTARKNIIIRSEITETYRGAAHSGDTYYHGTYVLMDGDGYWYNASSSVDGVKAGGLMKSEFFIDQSTAGLTPGTMTATASGSFTTNTNCFDVYIGGEFDAEFDTGTSLTKAYEGMTVYVFDNDKLTVDPAVGLFPIGVLSKYYSATTGCVKLDGFAYKKNTVDLFFPITATTWTSQRILGVLNPFGCDMMVTDFKLCIQTPTTTGGQGSVGISPTSTAAIATWIISSSMVDSTTAGVYSPFNTLSTDNPDHGVTQSAVPRIWSSTEYLCIACATTTSAAGTGFLASFVGYAHVTVQKF